jgi:hypothetical protein
MIIKVKQWYGLDQGIIIKFCRKNGRKSQRSSVRIVCWPPMIRTTYSLNTNEAFYSEPTPIFILITIRKYYFLQAILNLASS